MKPGLGLRQAFAGHVGVATCAALGLGLADLLEPMLVAWLGRVRDAGTGP